MNNIQFAGLQIAGTGLIALGVTNIATNFIQGLVEIVLGVVLYVIYEVIPPKV